VKTDFRHYQFGDFLLDAEEGVLYRDGERVALQRKVFDLLLLFVRSEGRVLQHDEIIQQLWADTTVEQSNLKQSIYVLRRALGESPDENTFIKTLPKRGYRFLAEVRVLPAERHAVIAERTITDVFIEEEIIEEEEETVETKRLALSPSNISENRGARHFQPRPLLAGLFFLIIFLTVGYGVYRYDKRVGAAMSPVNLENASWQKLTNTGDVHFAVISPDAALVAYVALSENGEQSIRVLNVANRSEMTVVPPAQTAFWGVSFTPDSSRIYYTAWERSGESKAAKLYSIPVFGGTPRKILEPINSPISFSPDGRRLVFTRHTDDFKTLCLVTADAEDGGDQRVIAVTRKNEFVAPNFSPDGKRVLYTAGDNREDGWYWHLAEIPSDGGEARVLNEPRKGRFFGAIWFPDGKGILLSAQASDSKLIQLWYVSYPDGEISRITNDLAGYSSLGISADGRNIISVQLNRTNSIWSIPFSESVSRAAPRRLTEDTLLIQSMAWTHDERIVFDSFDNGKTHLWMMNADGSNKHQLTPENIEEYRPAVSPDGRFLIFLSNRSGKWHLWRAAPDGGEPKQLTFGKDSPQLGKFAFGGEKIIVEHFLNDQWRLAQLSIEGGELIPVTDAAPVFWDVAPDGKTIAYSFSDDALNRTRVAVQSIENKTEISYLDIVPRDFLIFAPDGKSLLTKPPSKIPDSNSSIYSYPIKGGEPQKIVANPPENFYWADVSQDGKQLAWVQGKVVSNVVLLKRRD
jgi:Tol biopolymer transport system component/DNA-binding winged helix-turn-helix (wHTH) protein